MKPSTKDQIQGKLHEAKGQLKQTAGEITDNPELAGEGRDEKVVGKVQNKIGQIKKVFEN